MIVRSTNLMAVLLREEKYEKGDATVDACRPMRFPVLDMISLPAGSGRLLRAENREAPLEQRIIMRLKLALLKMNCTNSVQSE